MVIFFIHSLPELLSSLSLRKGFSISHYFNSERSSRLASHADVLRLRHAASPCVFRSRAPFNIARTHNSQWGTNEKRKFALTWKSSQHSRSLRSYPLPIIPLCLSREAGVISFSSRLVRPWEKKKIKNKNAWSQVNTRVIRRPAQQFVSGTPHESRHSAPGSCY